jgi:hypothetical protein
MTWKIHMRIRIDKFQSGLPAGCGDGSSMVMGIIEGGAGGEGLGAILLTVVLLWMFVGSGRVILYV